MSYVKCCKCGQDLIPEKDNIEFLEIGRGKRTGGCKSCFCIINEDDKLELMEVKD